MLFEHLIFSTAIAIIAGMLWYKRTGRDPSWIIISSAFAPDFDAFSGEMFKKLDMNILIDGAPIRHGDFHNIAFMLLFATAAALVLRLGGMRFGDSFLFAGIGFAAHMFEDALVANPAYAFFWPISAQEFGIGIIQYRPDWYGIANTDVLIIGIISILLCWGIRAGIERKDSLRRIAKAMGVAVGVAIIMLALFTSMDVKVLERMNSYTEKGHIDNWVFTQNASWDSTVSHSGSYSAKIEIPMNITRTSGGWLSDKIAVKPKTSYILSVWGKTKNVEKNGSHAVTVVELNASSKSINQTRLVFGGTDDWTRKQVRFTTSNNTSKVYVYAYISKGFGALWVDDVELYEELNDNNLIINGGFEKSAKSIFFPS